MGLFSGKKKLKLNVNEGLTQEKEYTKKEIQLFKSIHDSVLSKLQNDERELMQEKHLLEIIESAEKLIRQVIVPQLERMNVLFPENATMEIIAQAGSKPEYKAYLKNKEAFSQATRKLEATFKYISNAVSALEQEDRLDKKTDSHLKEWVGEAKNKMVKIKDINDRLSQSI
jgi:hypothetical protein